MKITVTKDFRCFKAGDVFDFSIMKEGLGSLTIVGENGCGKSSLLQALRGKKNDNPTTSLYESDFKDLAKNIEIEHEYEKIYYFDGVKDNGSDMMVGYDAMNFLDSGGYAKQRLSHGEGSLMYISRFMKNHEAKLIPNKTLLVFDEIDNGLSLKNQAIFVNFIYRLMIKDKCHVLIISHNAFFIQQSILVYDLAKKDIVKAKEYIKELTGFVLDKVKDDTK